VTRRVGVSANRLVRSEQRLRFCPGAKRLQRDRQAT
jgi:hypothetical protein